MTVVIGIDPHKASHTATAIGPGCVEAATIRLRAARSTPEELLIWAAQWPERRWGVEGARGLGQLLAQQLFAACEHVVDVPATLSARVRTLETGHGRKTDRIDAGITDHPTGVWTTQAERNLLIQHGHQLADAQALVRDRASQFIDAFDEIFRTERMNNTHRPHRALDQRPPVAADPPQTSHTDTSKSRQQPAVADSSTSTETPPDQPRHSCRHPHPTGMIFVPCQDGLSHNEAESIEPEAAGQGADVLLQAALELTGTADW